MKRLIILFVLLILCVLTSLYSLEETQFQAKILIDRSDEVELDFPLSKLHYRLIEEYQESRLIQTEFIHYNSSQQESTAVKDLCGFYEPTPTSPEGVIFQ
ncbi:MAG: hypothetical protein PQJ59_16150 [Spirochaetales bacterium]|nr:hypothetical protein [Spirochaetales bacterium]